MNQKILLVIVAVVAAGAGFFGGIQYTKLGSQNTAAIRNFANLTPEERQARMGNVSNRNPQGGAVNGEIIGKDDKSITVKMRDGGTKIVFFSVSTKVTKTADGLAADLQNGKQVMVIGSANQDGSVSAQAIQIR